MSTKTNDFTKIITERRSIRSYDPTVTISREELSDILTIATTAPSSINMQPWRFVVVDTPAGKDKLAPLMSFNAKQHNTSSAMILVFGDRENFSYAEKILSQSVDAGIMPLEVKEKQLQTYTPFYANMSEDQLLRTIFVDAGLVSMQLMLAARAYGYDTNAIGGFDRDNLAATFDLDPKRYLPVMVISIGKAAEEGFPSTRLPLPDITTWA